MSENSAGETEVLRHVLHLIGGIAISYSRIERYWFFIFKSLLPSLTDSQAKAIFHQFDSSAMQRSLVVAVAQATYKLRSPEAIRIGQLNALSQDVAGSRNAAIHMQLNVFMTKGGIEFEVGEGSHPTKKNRLAGKEVESQLLSVASTIRTLEDHLGKFLRSISPAGQYPPDLREELIQLEFQPLTVGATP